jgi:hypothetical protein
MNRFILTLASLLLPCLGTTLLFGQSYELPVPKGEAITSTIGFNFVDTLNGPQPINTYLHRLAVTAHTIYALETNPSLKYGDALYHAPIGRSIARVDHAEKRNSNAILVTLDNGAQSVLNFSDQGQLTSTTQTSAAPPSSTTAQFVLAAERRGNNSFVTFINNIALTGSYRSSDRGATWAIDSVRTDAIDVFGNIYGRVGDTTFYVLKAGANDWQQLAWPVPARRKGVLFATPLYISRNNLFYFPNFIRSTDGGQTWLADSAGLMEINTLPLGEDGKGSIYARSTSSFRILVRTSGSWTVFAPASPNGLDTSLPLINYFDGDSPLLVSTRFDLLSGDASALQKLQPGLPAEKINDAVADGNTHLFSTGDGVFRMGQPDFLQTFPAPPTYFNRAQFFYTGDHRIFMTGVVQGTYPSVHPPDLLTTHDGGATWQYDTAGFYQFASPTFPQDYVDALGTEHIFFSYPPVTWQKTGNGWIVDSAGLGAIPYLSITSMMSDKNGGLFLSLSSLRGYLFYRARTDVRWSQITVTPADSMQVTGIAHDPATDRLFLAGDATGLVYRQGSIWKKATLPSQLPADSRASMVNLDSNGNIFVAFTDAQGNPIGVYYSSNLQRWRSAGLDGVAIAKMVSYISDSTIVITDRDLRYVRSIYLDVASAANSERTLTVFPNPARDQISYSFSQEPRSITLINTLGQVVRRTTDGANSQGTLDVRDLPQGLYLVKATFKERIETTHLVIER